MSKSNEAVISSGLQELSMTCSHDSNPEFGGVLVAPVLRVEELKDEENGERIEISSGINSSCSSLYESDDERRLSGEGTSDEKDKDGNTEQSGESGDSFVVPSDEIRDKIIAQVEFYFSDANIVTDAFMLKHVKKNKHGYVSLKLVASFRKVKSITKDYRVVAYCLQQSKKLQVNDEGTKVRRVDPLPEYDNKAASRTVVAFNIASAHMSSSLSVESVSEQFSAYGDIALVRILRPGKPLPPDVKRHVSKHPELLQENMYSTVIEFESNEAAVAACNAMTDTSNWRTGVRVVILESKQQQPGKGKKNFDGEGGNKHRGGGAVNGQVNSKVGDSGGGGGKKNSGKSAVGGDGNTDDSKSRNIRNSLSPQLDPNRLSPCHSAHSSPKSSPRSSPTPRRKSVPVHSPLTQVESVSAGNSPSQSPWVQRRLKAGVTGGPLSVSAGNSPGTSPNMKRKDVGTGTGGDKSLLNIIRQPKGPDGSKGFHRADESAEAQDTTDL